MGDDALADQRTDPAEAPAQFAARIVGHVPEEIAELRPALRIGSKDQIGKQRPHLARSRQLQFRSLTADGHRPEEADFERRPLLVRRFHGRSHA